jgi:hypothetical protein
MEVGGEAAGGKISVNNRGGSMFVDALLFFPVVVLLVPASRGDEREKGVAGLGCDWEVGERFLPVLLGRSSTRSPV